MPRLLDRDPDLPTVITRAAALAAGLTDDQIAYRVRVGRWQRIARGSYRRTDWAPDLLDDFARARLDHVQRAVLAARRNPGSVIGFASAALIHGLPIEGPPPTDVTLLVSPGAWTGTRHGIRFRRGMVDKQDLSPHRVAVTSVARTWLDLARTETLAMALVVGDAALARRTVERDQLSGAVVLAEGRRGFRRAQLAVQHIDGRRESPLESQSWAYFVEHRLELPELQVEIRSRTGGLIARVDVLWREARLVGECDGRLKYGSPGDLYAEKRREDAVRAEGFGVLRWGAVDLRTPDLARRIRRALM